MRESKALEVHLRCGRLLVTLEAERVAKCLREQRKRKLAPCKGAGRPTHTPTSSTSLNLINLSQLNINIGIVNPAPLGYERLSGSYGPEAVERGTTWPRTGIG